MKVCAYIDVRYIDREIEIKIELVEIGINKCVLNIPYCKKKWKEEKHWRCNIWSNPDFK